MKNLQHKVWHNPIYFIAFGFGSGLSPFAPGTCGTIAAIPLYLLLSCFNWPIYLSVTILAFILGVIVSEIVSRELGLHDYKGIVWDEVVGFLLTMFLLPRSILFIILGFLLFRFFDILKPFPIRLIDEKLQGGLGVMLDDILAAVFAWIVLQIIRYYLL